MVLDVQNDLSGPEDVTSINEGEGNAFGDIERPVVINSNELTKNVFGVDEVVARGEELSVVVFAVFVEPLDVHFMDVGGVREHDAAEVTCGRSGVNVPGETIVAELR